MTDKNADIKMVNVSEKEKTHRTAIAEGAIYMSSEAFKAVNEGKIPKGDVISCARVAAIQGAKKTSSILPLCHPIAITSVEIAFDTSKEGKITVKTKVEGFDRTGFEMEALTAASIALLTIYDMCKSIDKSMTISEVRLLEKTGGKSKFSRPVE